MTTKKNNDQQSYTKTEMNYMLLWLESRFQKHSDLAPWLNHKIIVIPPNPD